MSEYPGFGVLLARLLDRRELDARSLSGAESEKGELQAVLGGAVPSPSLLRWLATALGMHVLDLYLIAGVEVPPDLAPLDAKAGPQTARLAWKAGELPERHQGELLGFARSLPQQDRAEPFPPPREYEQYPPGFGGMRLPAEAQIPLNPPTDTMAELTWEARRLTAEQVKLVHGRAEAIRQR